MKAELTRQLWKMSEESCSLKTQLILEIAGNLVEATFDTDDYQDSIDKAIADAKKHLGVR